HCAHRVTVTRVRRVGAEQNMSLVAIIYIAYKCYYRVRGRVSVRHCGGGGGYWPRVSTGRPGGETTAASHSEDSLDYERKKRGTSGSTHRRVCFELWCVCVCV